MYVVHCWIVLFEWFLKCECYNYSWLEDYGPAKDDIVEHTVEQHWIICLNVVLNWSILYFQECVRAQASFGSFLKLLFLFALRLPVSPAGQLFQPLLKLLYGLSISCSSCQSQSFLVQFTRLLKLPWSTKGKQQWHNCISLRTFYFNYKTICKHTDNQKVWILENMGSVIFFSRILLVSMDA